MHLASALTFCQKSGVEWVLIDPPLIRPDPLPSRGDYGAVGLRRRGRSSGGDAVVVRRRRRDGVLGLLYPHAGIVAACRASRLIRLGPGH